MSVINDWNCMYYERTGVMDGLRQYILSLICAAFICSVLKTLLRRSKSATSIANIVCGLFLAITAISPIIDIQIPDINTDISSLYKNAAEISMDGWCMSQMNMAKIIKEETSAYILEKAKLHNMDVDVEVILDDQDVPNGVIITGAVSPYDKTVLESYID